MSSFQKIAVPATRSSSALLKAKRRGVIAGLVFCMLSGVLGLVVALRDSGTTATGGDPTSYAAVAVASQAGQDYLAMRTSTVPAAAGVDTDWSDDLGNGAKATPFRVSSFTYAGSSAYYLGDNADHLVRLLRFRVVADGTPYYLDVPVMDTGTLTVLAAEPALMPAPAGEQKAVDPADYDRLYNADGDTANLVDVIGRWADAFASGDGTELQTIAADPDASHQYVGLGGWKVVGSPQIGHATPVGGGDTGKPTGLVVQVQLVLSSPAANGPTVTSQYDLYVTDTDGATPHVIAWGSQGSYEELTPYMNAR